MIDEPIREDDPKHEPSFDESHNLNFQPSSQMLDSAEEPRRKVNRSRKKLDVEESEVLKSLRRNASSRKLHLHPLPLPQKSVKPTPTAAKVKGKE